MNEFNLIETACLDAMSKYQLTDSLAFQCGYYKAQTKRLCDEVEFLKQELESTIEQIKDITRDLA
jgi:hypothetical protein